jgi:integrase
LLCRAGTPPPNRVRACLSAYFAWLLREGIVEANPALNTNKATEGGARTHMIADDELARLWNALGDDQYSSVVKLLCLTGPAATRSPACAGQKSISITLPPASTKSRREHQIPLAPAALAILQAQPRRVNPDGSPRDLVFGHGRRGWQDWSGSKADLDALIQPPIRGWRPHDFRGSMSTTMHERLGVVPWVVEASLGHAGGHQGRVAGVYNQSSYFELRRIALGKWADHVVSLATGERPPTVVTLRRA